MTFEGDWPSPVGALCSDVPAYATHPPIEAVVFAWGASEDHQLGLDTSDNIESPKVVEYLLGLQLRGRAFLRTPLIGGSRNTLAIDAEGGLWSWGWNDRGTLGHGHRAMERKPRRVQGLQGVVVVQAAIGGWHCLALSDSGRVFSWGGNEYQQCGLSPEACAEARARDVLLPQPCLPGVVVRQVSCGGMSSLALTEGGEVWTWGEPWGDFALNVVREPRKVEGAVAIAAIAAGAFHHMALNNRGEVFCWGTNDYGQLGTGNTDYSTQPVKVVDLEEVPVADIAAGGWHSLVLSADGGVYVWGRGEYGRLGIGDRTGSSKLRPHKVRGMEGHVAVQVAAGGTHSLALTSGGRMFTWGRGSYGRLGLGGSGKGSGGDKDHYSPVECVLPGGYERWRIAAIACGGRHSMCLAVPLRESAAAAVAAALPPTQTPLSDTGSWRPATAHSAATASPMAMSPLAASSAGASPLRNGGAFAAAAAAAGPLPPAPARRPGSAGSAGRPPPGPAQQLTISPRASAGPMSPSNRSSRLQPTSDFATWVPRNSSGDGSAGERTGAEGGSVDGGYVAADAHSCGAGGGRRSPAPPAHAGGGDGAAGGEGGYAEGTDGRVSRVASRADTLSGDSLAGGSASGLEGGSDAGSPHGSGGRYDVTMDEVMARMTNGLPLRSNMHREAHS